MTALQSMVRVHRWVLEEKQRKLAELQSLADRLRGDLTQLDSELEAERQAAEASDEAGLAYPSYVAAALDRRRRICETIDNLETEVEAAREEVAESFAELKKYEIARDNQQRRKTAKHARRERADLDEIGISIYRRTRARRE